LAALERDAAAVIQLPAPDDLLQLVFDLEKRLLGDVGRGREELRRIFRDGRITFVPQPGGFYIARSEILPLVLLTPPPSEGDQGGRYTAVSCARARLATKDLDVWVEASEENAPRVLRGLVAFGAPLMGLTEADLHVPGVSLSSLHFWL
jgi:hypothetical protein